MIRSVRFLRVAKVAEKLGIDVSTVRDLISRGHFPSARKIDPTRRNSPILIDPIDLEKYQQKQLEHQEIDK